MKKTMISMMVLAMLLGLFGCKVSNSDAGQVAATNRPATSQSESRTEPSQTTVTEPTGSTTTETTTANSTTTEATTVQTPETSATKVDSTQQFIDAINVETAAFKGVCGNDATWYYLDNVLVIKGTGAIADYGEDHLFSMDRPWKDLQNSIHWVIVDEGITGIGINTFRNLPQLVKVALPDTLTHVGLAAFSRCEKLPEITIPDGVTGIGEDAFFDCASLAEIVIPDSVIEIGEDAFDTGAEFNQDVLAAIYYSNADIAEYVENHPELPWVKR